MSVIPDKLLVTDDFVTVRNLKFHYRQWRPAASEARSTPIVLIHGLASALSIWDLVAPELVAAGYNVTAIDQRGHGESDKPHSGYDFATIVSDDAAIFQQLGLDKPLLVGHSWGAMVALEYAATFPDHVAGLVLVDGATSQFSMRPGWTREKAIVDLAPPRFAGTPREQFLSYYRQGPLGSQWSEQLEESILNIVRLREDDTVEPRLEFENHLQIIGAMWDQQVYALYAQLHCPVRLIVAEHTSDEQDRARAEFKNEGLLKIQQANPAVSIMKMENTIHDIPLQRPEQLAQSILESL